jgi:hypothetical protein
MIASSLPHTQEIENLQTAIKESERGVFPPSLQTWCLKHLRWKKPLLDNKVEARSCRYQ